MFESFVFILEVADYERKGYERYEGLGRRRGEK